VSWWPWRIRSSDIDFGFDRNPRAESMALVSRPATGANVQAVGADRGAGPPGHLSACAP